MGTPLGPKYIPYTYMDPLGYGYFQTGAPRPTLGDLAGCLSRASWWGSGLMPYQGFLGSPCLTLNVKGHMRTPNNYPVWS